MPKSLTKVHKSYKNHPAVLKATKTIGIIYAGNEERDLTIKGYFDSDWAGDYTTRKLISGFVFILNGR